MKMSLNKMAALGLIALIMTGCAGTNSGNTNNIKVVINDKGVPNYYRVKRGDTVSGIAQRYHMNYRKIGALNNLNSRYTIYAGQWLKLWEGSAATTSYQPTKNSYQPTKNKPAPVIQQNNSSVNTYPNTYNPSSLGFKYPSSNYVIKQYDMVNNVLGMWFAGNAGDPVYASKSGSVIYAGNGLQEYGNLIMVNHGNDYVTAYAHNSQLLVNEGDVVTKGQKIATMGQTGNTSQVALEFQVRQGGRAIDPRRVLNK